MAITEPNYASGALSLTPIKPRTMKKGKIAVGKNYTCDLTEINSKWKRPFIGEVLYIYNNAATVKILSTEPCDNKQNLSQQGMAVVPLRCMKQFRRRKK